MSRTAVVLAGGAGERMRSQVPKVLHGIAGRSVLEHVLLQLADLEIDRIVVVVGTDGGAIAKHVTDVGLGIPIVFAEQAVPDGTASAAGVALESFGSDDPDGELLILPGDIPLIRAATLDALLATHHRSQAALTLLTAEVAGELPRVRRNARGEILGVGSAIDHDSNDDTETQDDPNELAERSPLVMCVRRSLLAPALRRLDRTSGEATVVGAVEVIAATGNRVESFQVEDATESLGVNDRMQLAEATSMMRARIAEQWMAEGVTIIDPTQTYIDASVVLGNDSTIFPGVHLLGRTVIGVAATIGPDCKLLDTVVGDGSTISYSVVSETEIGSECTVGPYAHLRPGTRLNDHSKVGSFVEVKNADIGKGAKLPHLAYVGDATVGEAANIGCGTITANYDGRKKHRTEIGPGARIGSNSVLVAPVTIGEGAYTAAGSVVTTDVPPGALARGVPAKIIENWVAERAAREDHAPPTDQ